MFDFLALKNQVVQIKIKRLENIVEIQGQLIQTHKNELKRKDEEKTVLKKEKELLEQKLEKMEMEKKNPQGVIESIMEKKLDWFNYQSLPADDRFRYYQEAQAILNSKVFQNEINYLITCWSKWALQNAVDFNGVRDMRMSANGLQLLRERLEEVENPVTKINQENLYDAI